jgi:hypothetical protein
MEKKVKVVLLCILLLYSSYCYAQSSLSCVVLAGAKIKASSVVDNTKPKRKDCTVCKGKGWYMSGDGIKRIDCNYCEPDNNVSSSKSPSCEAKNVK